jgi:hypothetical protein
VNSGGTQADCLPTFNTTLKKPKGKLVMLQKEKVTTLQTDMIDAVDKITEAIKSGKHVCTRWGDCFPHHEIVSVKYENRRGRDCLIGYNPQGKELILNEVFVEYFTTGGGVSLWKAGYP